MTWTGHTVDQSQNDLLDEVLLWGTLMDRMYADPCKRLRQALYHWLEIYIRTVTGKRGRIIQELEHKPSISHDDGSFRNKHSIVYIIFHWAVWYAFQKLRHQILYMEYLRLPVGRALCHRCDSCTTHSRYGRLGRSENSGSRSFPISSSISFCALAFVDG